MSLIYVVAPSAYTSVYINRFDASGAFISSETINLQTYFGDFWEYSDPNIVEDTPAGVFWVYQDHIVKASRDFTQFSLIANTGASSFSYYDGTWVYPVRVSSTDVTVFVSTDAAVWTPYAISVLDANYTNVSVCSFGFVVTDIGFTVRVTTDFVSFTPYSHSFDWSSYNIVGSVGDKLLIYVVLSDERHILVGFSPSSGFVELFEFSPASWIITATRVSEDAVYVCANNGSDIGSEVLFSSDGDTYTSIFSSETLGASMPPSQVGDNGTIALHVEDITNDISYCYTASGGVITSQVQLAYEYGRVSGDFYLLPDTSSPTSPYFWQQRVLTTETL